MAMTDQEVMNLFANLVNQLKTGKIKMPNNSGGANGAQILAKIAGLDVSGGTLAATANAPGDNTESVALIGQKDSSVASKATLDIETEEVVATAALTTDKTFSIWINGVEYLMGLKAV